MTQMIDNFLWYRRFLFRKSELWWLVARCVSLAVSHCCSICRFFRLIRLYVPAAHINARLYGLKLWGAAGYPPWCVSEACVGCAWFIGWLGKKDPSPKIAYYGHSRVSAFANIPFNADKFTCVGMQINGFYVVLFSSFWEDLCVRWWGVIMC